MPFDFEPFEAVLLDLDGTLYHEDHALSGAVDLVRRLQRERRKYACLTNSTSSPERIVSRLTKMGIPIDTSHVYTAAAAAVDYVLETFGGGPAPLPRVFNLATEGVQEMLEGKVHWVQSDAEPCDAVVVGVPVNVYATEERQRTAMLLGRKGAKLVGICADRVYPSPRGLEFGVGALCSMLSYACAAEPVFCGKPERFFYDELCRRLAVRPERCVLVGDNLESDIAGAKRVGMKTVLTLTGVSSQDDAGRVPAGMGPEWIIEDLHALL